MLSTNTKARLKEKIDNKAEQAKEFTWELLEILCENLATPIHKIIPDNLLSISTSEKIAYLKTQHNSEEVLKILKNQIELLTKLKDKLSIPQQEKVYHALLNVYEKMLAKREQGTTLKIESVVFQLIHELMLLEDEIIAAMSPQLKVNEEDTKALFHRIVRNIEMMLSIINFFVNDCDIISENNQFQKPDFGLHEMGLKSMIAEALFKENQSGWEKYLHNYTQKLQKLSDVDPTSYVIGLEWYYVFKTKVAISQNDLMSAKRYFMKSHCQAIKSLDKGISITEVVRNSLSIILLLDKAKKYSEAIMYTSLTMNLLKSFLASPSSAGLTAENKINHEHTLQSTFWMKEQYKAQLVSEHVSKLNELKSEKIKFYPSSITNAKHAKRYQIVLIMEDETLKKECIRLCERAGILFEMKCGFVVLDKAHTLSIDKVLSMIRKLSKMAKALAESEAANPDKTAAIPAGANTITSSTLNTSINNNNYIPPVPIPSTYVISWGDNVPVFDRAKKNKDIKDDIFELYAPYVKHIFVCVDERIAQHIYAKNKFAYVDLESMCDVGKVLGTSKGKKGFIIQGKPFGKNPSAQEVAAPKKKSKKQKQKQKEKEKGKEKEELKPEAQKNQPSLYIKGKNCSKPWRFYGSFFKQTTITTETTGKTNTFILLRIDGWREKHKGEIIRADKLTDANPPTVTLGSI